jgi:hypothetical protein
MPEHHPGAGCCQRRATGGSFLSPPSSTGLSRPGLACFPDESLSGFACACLQALQLQPSRGALETPVPTDPTIYRFYEVLQVYGPTIKELIHEEFGDGIMSAINFRLDVQREPAPDGDRVVVVLDGKFLPYQW